MIPLEPLPLLRIIRLTFHLLQRLRNFLNFSPLSFNQDLRACLSMMWENNIFIDDFTCLLPLYLLRKNLSIVFHIFKYNSKLLHTRLSILIEALTFGLLFA